ncbi:MAG: ferredoxin, partial [Planctomycetia bacterium]|nr:ferredoxin [Planctomycetia bacterium]
SLDPVALDQACVDLIYQSPDKGKGNLIKRMESRHAVHILEAAEELGIGSRKSRLVNI